MLDELPGALLELERAERVQAAASAAYMAAVRTTRELSLQAADAENTLRTARSRLQDLQRPPAPPPRYEFEPGRPGCLTPAGLARLTRDAHFELGFMSSRTQVVVLFSHRVVGIGTQDAGVIERHFAVLGLEARGVFLEQLAAQTNAIRAARVR